MPFFEWNWAIVLIFINESWDYFDLTDRGGDSKQVGQWGQVFEELGIEDSVGLD